MSQFKSPKSIVILVTDPSTLRILVTPQASALKSAGWNVHMICGSGDISNIETSESIRLFQIDSLVRKISLRKDLVSLFRLFCTIRSIGPSIIISSTPKASFLGMIVATILRLPRRIYQIRGARWERKTGLSASITKLTDNMALLLSTDLIAVSVSLKNLYENNFKIRKTISVLGKGSSKGVDLSIFRSNQNFVLDFTNLTFGFVGRLTTDKGIDDLLRIFFELQRFFPNSILEIVGSFDETDPISKESKFKIMNSEEIKFFENIDPQDVAARMQTWAMHIFPSHREGLPNAVIEAAACGTPTIGWDIGGVLDALPDRYKDFAIEFGDVEKASWKIVEVLNNSNYYTVREEFTAWSVEHFDQVKVKFALVNYLDSKN